ncbi:MAG: 50S ribosomal protein L29, partial [Planctomycetes bacterium]|nr:50S ribosomal protein L29 [Planctomycetota bacterium]
MKLSEIREKTDAELQHKLDEARKELFNLRFRKATDVIEDPSRLRAIRVEGARIHTVLRERKLGLKRGVPTSAAATA